MSNIPFSAAQKGKAIKLIQMIARTYHVNFVDIVFGTVVAGSYNSNARTISVTPVTGNSDTQIDDVNLQADQGDGELQVPSDGSTVVVCLSAILDPFVICGQDFDSIMWKGGNFGGLVKVKELTDKINAIEKLLNDLVIKFD